VAKGKKSKRGKRLKQSMLKALSAAGSSGITVKELAAKLKVKPGNIFSWFYTTGKKIGGIKKIGEAKYAYSS
jgi:phage antirepressor YoqD-like protein